MNSQKKTPQHGEASRQIRHVAGNHTTFNPEKHMEPQYCTYAITQENYEQDGVPLTNIQNVLRAKHCVDINEK